MPETRKLIPAFIAALAIQPFAMAADAPAAAEPEATIMDEEEQLDDGLKRFGYLAGVARGCVVEEQRPALEREALDVNATIARLLGVDRAFMFASAFGYGTTVVVEAKDCPEVLKTYEARVETYRSSQGGGK